MQTAPKTATEGGKPTSRGFFVLDNLEVAWERGREGSGLATQSRVSSITFSPSSRTRTTSVCELGSSAQNRSTTAMPLGRYPDRVNAFRKWANEKVGNSKLSDSATPSGRRSSAIRRKRRRKKRKQKDG